MTTLAPAQQKFPTLYSLSSKGKLHQWTIKAEGDSYFTEHGYVDGKIIITLPYKATPKNIGRANETSPHEQAVSEAQSVWSKKAEQGGVTDPALAKHEAPLLVPKGSYRQSHPRKVCRRRLVQTYRYVV